MRPFERVSREDGIFDVLDDLGIVEGVDDFVGVEGYEGGSYAGVDLVLLVAEDEVAENVLLSEVVHEAHVVVALHLINNNS